MKLNTEIAHCIPENGNSMTNTKKRKKSLELLEEKVQMTYKGDKFIINRCSTTAFYWGEKWINVELTLEQGGFELCGSTYVRIAFNTEYYGTAPSVVLWICRCETVDMKELWIRSAKYKLYLNFLLCGGSSPQLCVVQPLYLK